MALAVCMLSACSSDLAEESDVTENYQTIVEVENDQALADEVLDVLNEYRVSLDLPPLEWHEDSEDLATGHSHYMAEKNKASHDHFIDRADFLKDRGAEKVSENVAYGFKDAQSVVDAWLKSDGHRKAIEGNNTHTGIGIIRNEQGIPFFTQMFIR